MSVRVCGYLLDKAGNVRFCFLFAMDNEKLIEVVKGYKNLYDLSDKKYSDNQTKNRAWKEIGIQLKRNGNDCKKAWALLRDAYRRANKKRKNTKSGQANKKWKYEDEMSFLLPYMKERPTISPPVPDFDTDDNANEEEEIPQLPEVDQKIFPATLDCSQLKPNIALDAREQMVGTLPNISSPLTNQNYSWSKCTKQGQKQTEETLSTVLIKYIIDSKKNFLPPDDIEQFMAGITTTLQSFPARDKAIAKAKIFEIVSRMEIEILSRLSSSNSVVSTPSHTNYDANTP